MVGNALEQEIIELYSDNPSSLYSINQIARKLGKTYPYINKKVTSLIKNNIFNKTVIGRSHLCSLNLRNDETIYLLILSEIRAKARLIEKNPQARKATQYIEQLSRTAKIQLAIKTNETILLIMEDATSQENISRAIVKEGLAGNPYQIITKQEFLDKLVSSTEIQEEHIILYGYEQYYRCIREVEDKLKLKYSKIIPE